MPALSEIPARKLHKLYATIRKSKKKQEGRLSLGWADGTTFIRRPASDFRSRKESDFPKWLQSHGRYGDAAISNVKR